MHTKIGYIYVLSLKSDGEVRYVGQTVVPKERLWQHMAEARTENKTHKHRWLLKHGYEKVQLEVIEACPIDKLKESEDFYITYFRFLGFDLFNIVPGGYNLRGFKHSDESRKKNSELRIKHFAIPENRAKQAEATRKTFESKERRIKQSRCQGGKPIHDHTGKYYESAQEAANELGIASCYIRFVLAGRQLTCKGYAFAYADQPVPKLLSKEEVHESRVKKQREGNSPTAPKMLQDQFGNVYQSLSEAAISQKVSTYVLKNSIKKNQSINGFVFRII